MLAKLNRPCLVAVLLLVATLGAGCTSSVQQGSTSSAARPSSKGLPLDLPTGTASQVVTVTATSQNDTTATLQAWTLSNSTWHRTGPKALAYLGAGGLTDHEQERLTKSPIGSFTLTQAFGRLSNPGTKLPFFRTTPRDWWVSEPGPDYNTHQRCSNTCDFKQGSPNARLFFVRPQYDLAVVIDYNRAPVRQGAGSGIFLHVTRGRPTAGCISIDEKDLVRVMRWLDPAKNPRILVGTS